MRLPKPESGTNERLAASRDITNDCPLNMGFNRD